MKIITYAEDANKRAEHGMERVHVVGHDWGGFTGFLLGLQHPSRVGRLLLCNTPGPWARLNPRVAFGLRRAWYAALVATRSWAGAWWRILRGHFPDAGGDAYADQFRDPARAAAASGLYRYYLRAARVILLRRAFEGQRLAAPTRLLFGADDFYIPLAVLDDIEAHGDDLALDVVRGCGHWIPEERPDHIADQARALFG